MIYLLAYQLSSGKKALAVSRENVLVGSENIEEAKTLVPNWNGYHKGGVTWSASATLYWASYHPCVIAIDNMNQAFNMLCNPEDQKITTEHNVWGNARYVIIKDESEFNIIFDPQLIDEGYDTAKPFWEKTYEK